MTAEDLRNLNAYLGPGPHTAAQLRRLTRVFLAPRVNQTLLAIADLDMTPLPYSLLYALFRAARQLPGVQVTATGHGAHRNDVTIASGGYSMTFDDHTGMLRSGSTGVFFDQGSAGTIMAQGIVSSLDEIPEGVAPVASRVARPPAIAINPRTGTPTTTLTLHMRLNHITAAGTAPGMARRNVRSDRPKVRLLGVPTPARSDPSRHSHPIRPGRTCCLSDHPERDRPSHVVPRALSAHDQPHHHNIPTRHRPPLVRSHLLRDPLAITTQPRSAPLITLAAPSRLQKLVRGSCLGGRPGPPGHEVR